jgi:membrane protein implicated in regulation of membrane protease activity
MNSLVWWVILFIASIMLELSSPGYFFFLAFSIGALAGAACSWLDIGTGFQFFAFVIVSIGAFFFLKNMLSSLSKDGHQKTNVYALQGKKGVVVDRITNMEKGWVKIDGELWAAVPVSDEVIEKNSLVEVVGTAGSHVRVKRI